MTHYYILNAVGEWVNIDTDTFRHYVGRVKELGIKFKVIIPMSAVFIIKPNKIKS